MSAAAAPLWDGIISGGQLRDWLHLPCHRMEGGGRGREVDEGEVLGGGGRRGWGGGGVAGTSRRPPRVEVTVCSPAVSLAWLGPARPGQLGGHSDTSSSPQHHRPPFFFAAA